MPMCVRETIGLLGVAAVVSFFLKGEIAVILWQFFYCRETYDVVV